MASIRAHPTVRDLIGLWLLLHPVGLGLAIAFVLTVTVLICGIPLHTDRVTGVVERVTTGIGRGANSVVVLAGRYPVAASYWSSMQCAPGDRPELVRNRSLLFTTFSASPAGCTR
jgi:hypothetical protein